MSIDHQDLKGKAALPKKVSEIKDLDKYAFWCILDQYRIKSKNLNDV